MADINRLARLLAGAVRGVDISQNTLVMASLKLDTSELTKEILDKLILVNNMADADGTFDTRYTAIGHATDTDNPHSVTKAQVLDDDLIVDADVDAAAAIAYSKLNLTGNIVNADIDEAAAIAYSKLNIADDDLTIAKTDGLQAALDARELIANKNEANGYAGLDAGGKIAASQLPSTVMELKGEWNAEDNIPALQDGVGTSGDIYEVTVAGTHNFGSGDIEFNVGDWVVYANDVYYKSINSNEVVTVNGYTGAVELDTDDIDEGERLYFTNARAIAAPITGFESGAGALLVTDTVLEAIEKLDGNIGVVSGNLADHLDGDPDKHKASEIDVEGDEYNYVSAGDLETAIGALDAQVHTNASSIGELSEVETLSDMMAAGETYAADAFAVVRSYMSGETAGRVYKADNDAETSDNFYAIGIAYPAEEVVAGEDLLVVKGGRMVVADHGFNPGALYLGSNGAITQTAPSDDDEAVVLLGFVIDANVIEVKIQFIAVN